MSTPSTPASDSETEITATAFNLDQDQILPLVLAESWLSVDERERAASFRFDIHRHRYIRGRGMVRALLARELGVDPASLEFELGPKGKPILRDESLEFNLSHSEDRAFFAYGRNSEIGVDIERLDRQVDYVGLSHRCFRPSEIAWMNSFPPETIHIAFFRIWTAKEARMKVSGEGFSLPPQQIELNFDAERPVEVVEPFQPSSHLLSLDLPDSALASIVAFAPFHLRWKEPTY